MYPPQKNYYLFIKIIFFYLYIGEIQKNIRKGKENN